MLMNRNKQQDTQKKKDWEKARPKKCRHQVNIKKKVRMKKWMQSYGIC